VLNDLRHACRLSAAAPGWTAAAVLSLSLGIAATTVMFSVIDAVLLNPFPYRTPDRLALIWGSKDVGVTRGLSKPDIEDWRRLTYSFEDIDGYLGNLTFSLDPRETARVPAACVGERVLGILGVQPALGRNFTASEARGGGDPVVLLSDELWRTRFDADPGILRRSIALDGRPHDVVGVLPAGFFFPDTDARLWVPAPCGVPGYEQRAGMALHAVARLREGVRIEEAQRDLDSASARLAEQYPETHRSRTAGVFPMRRIVIGRYERALWTLLGGLLLVLLIGSANVVHLQLARGLARENELAVRAANGATRARLIRQLLTESALLAGLAAIVALGLAWMGLRLVQALALTQIARLDQAALDARVLAFGLAMSIVAALASGAWPALRLSAVRPSDALKVGGAATATRRSRTARDLLATAEIAGATVLVVAAGLVVQSFLHVSRADWGFDPERLWLLEVRLPGELARDRQGQHELSAAIRSRLQSLPGVEAVAVSRTAPIRYLWMPTMLLADGRVMDGFGRWPIGPGYMATVGVRILEGREFDGRDDQGAPSRVIISRAAARRLWPGQSAVGRTIALLQIRDDPAKMERLRSGPRRLTLSDLKTSAPRAGR
jgi:putative ABC transport system permease protein